MQGSARKDVVFGAARVYTFTVPGPKWKSWVRLHQLSTSFKQNLVLSHSQSGRGADGHAGTERTF